MKLQTIKSDAEYLKVLSVVEALVDKDPEPNSVDGRLLDTWAVLIGKYEDEICPEEDILSDYVDPIKAIKFRMEQMGLKNVDLKGYIGSASKVSEVLNYKRDLTLKMIRALHKGLGIPLDVLAQEPDVTPEPKQDYISFPVKEMSNRGYFSGKITSGARLKDIAEDLVLGFLNDNSLDEAMPLAHYRRNISQAPGLNEHALLAWRYCILAKAKKVTVEEKYLKGLLTDEFITQLVQLSYMSEGPLLAQEFLRKSGIRLIVEEHFPKTRLDGAVTLMNDVEPIIGLTLRYDRIDYFWFTLFHELAHIKLHLDVKTKDDDSWYIDDLSIKDDGEAEEEADSLAVQWLLPDVIFNGTKASITHSAKDVRALAKELRISPAIIAGRIRNETRNYQKLSTLVGQGKLKSMFPEFGG
jgi:HTH-type transcriptional regulator / antitoxin HigA